MLDAPAVIRMTGIRKAFGATQAVNHVDLDIFAGEVHGLVGENGAGKSTLMRILAGFYPDYEGRIELADKEVRITGVRQARQLGIALVHQELSLVPELSVAENIFLGREPAAGIPGFISRSKAAEQTRSLLREIGLEIEPWKKVSQLSMAFQQLVEIAKGVSIRPRVLILDEPSSSLTKTETRELFKVIHRLKQIGTAIIYISHKLDEILELAQRITVLRDGVKVGSDTRDKWDEQSLVRAMVGREFSSLFPHNHSPQPKTVALSVKNLSRPRTFRNISFELLQGEVLGIYGLVGAGRSELLESLFGLEPAACGEIRVFGERVKIRHPWSAKRLGIALVPEDRRRRGLVLMQSVGRNLSLPVLKYLSSLGFVKSRQENREVAEIISSFKIHAASPAAAAETLSGGNQQKVALGKWLLRPPRILLLDEPTRGIDVLAKAEIHAAIDRLAQEGLAIILVSSELPEILGMSDRILVMREGEIAGEFTREAASAEDLGQAAMAGAGQRLAGEAR